MPTHDPPTADFDHESPTTPALGFRQPPQVPTFAPGQRLADRYRLGRLLGRGGMGEVYEVHDEELQVQVALKTLRIDLARDPRALRQLKQEVLLARSITHPHVCRMYDLGRHIEHGEDGGDGSVVWFLTMELLSGETLRELVQRKGRLSEAEALPLVAQMASGLEAAHRAGVVHLDFKSKNVMVVSDEEDGGGRVVVTDFGLARTSRSGSSQESNDGTAETRVAGTPAYMAPEQVRGEEAGTAADLYALGVVLYEMVTGRLPFTGKTSVEVALRRLVEDPPPPSGLVADLSARWEAVIQRCLAREARERYARAEEVKEALAGQTPILEPSGFLRVRFVLPTERDPFVGREAELRDLEAKLAAGSRLVTLLGTGGMGKTRLAVRYGWRSLVSWPGGVWFADLTETRDENGILAAVASALDVPLGKGDPALRLGHAIAARGRCLLIFDNCEQVASAIGELVDRWLERAPEAQFIVTSRERLRARGEDVLAVESLPLESGIELFIERAKRQRPGFEPERSELNLISTIVRLVEGMPLAIELVAARVRMMTLAQLGERMGERRRMLESGSGRHGSMQGAIEGSWELLAPWEQAAWAQCAVFEGGFTLEAAESVIDLTPWPEAPWVVDVVQSLTDKSLLRLSVPEAGGREMGAARFGMYVTLQEYARERLAELGPESERAAEVRHGRWFAQSYGTREAIDALHLHGGIERGKRLVQDSENLRRACRRAVIRSDPATAVATYWAIASMSQWLGASAADADLGEQILAMELTDEEEAIARHALGRKELDLGRMDAARHNFEAALALTRKLGSRYLTSVLLRSLGDLGLDLGRLDEARAHTEAALALHEELGDRWLACRAQWIIGVIHLERGQVTEAFARFEVALAIAREMADRHREGLLLGSLGILYAERGQMDEARAHYEKAIAIMHDEMGDPRAEATQRMNFGNLLCDVGRLAEARAQYEMSLTNFRKLGDRRQEGMVLGNLGTLHLEQDRFDDARGCFEAALAIAHEVRSRRTEGHVHGYLGDLYRKQGRSDEASAHYDEALRAAREAENRRLEGVTQASLGALRVEEGKIDEARMALAAGEAILRELGDQTALANLLCSRAELEHRTGESATAPSTLSEAETLAAQVGAGPESELARRIAKMRRTLAGE